MNPVRRLLPPTPRWRRAACALATTLLLAACGGGDGGRAAPAGASPPPVDTVPVLAQPFEAVGSSARTVSLAWAPPAEATAAAEYAVERRSGSSGEFARIATVQGRSGAFLDSGLEAGTTYSYRLAAAGGSRSETPAKAVTTTTEPAVVTPLGAALGELTGRTLGTAGGTLTSHDGQVAVEVPAGALAGDTATETQPVANTAPDGRGIGLKVRLAAAPRAPLTLKLRYDAAQDDEADAMRIAVQRPAGDWTSLPLASIDKTTRTLRAQLPPEFVATAATPGLASVGLEFHIVKYLAFTLKPKMALVKVNTSLEFVPYARVRGWDTEIGTCEPMPDGRRVCILQPMLEEREMPFANEKAGFSRSWWVSAVKGGNSTVGTIVPKAGVGATYTAPAKVPQPSTVRVLFHSLNMSTLRKVDLIALVDVWDDSWQGELNGVDGPSSTNTTYLNKASVRWVPDAPNSTATVKAYRGEGEIVAWVTDDDCTVTLAPDRASIDTDTRFVSLKIDESTTPMTYKARLITFFPSQVTAVCPRGAATTYARTAGWGWDVSGQVAADGRTIEGEAVTEDGYKLSWKFTR